VRLAGDSPGLRRHLAAPARLPLRLHPVTVDTDDGHTWDGLELTPSEGDPERRRLAVIVVHGSVGNYISGVPRHISYGLAQAGFTVVSVNTRMANYGVFFGTGLMHRTPLDLDAWMGFVRRMGHERIVLLGYSLGATMVTHYQALCRPVPVVGLCTLAHPLSLPASLRRRWERFGADPAYETVAQRAREMLGDDPDDDDCDDEIFIVERASGPTLAPHHAEIWTYRTWWFSRGPEANHAVSAEWIEGIGVPLALIQAGEDMIVPASDGESLAAAALRASNRDVRHESIPYANHVFSGREAAAVERCVAWLDHVILGREGATAGLMRGPVADLRSGSPTE
jgi:dienelactone hydrolase